MTDSHPQIYKLVSADTWHGDTNSWHGEVKEGTKFPPEAGRYHLYIGLFCPFAHRANLVRHLKGLTDIMDISIVRPWPKGDPDGFPGWAFPKTEDEYPGATTDKLFQSGFLHDLYFKVDPNYSGRYFVPVLWDKKNNTIVNNESAELLRTMGNAFNPIIPEEFAKVELYPEEHRSQIDTIEKWMQRDLNAGVYKAGFAPNQEVYDKNVIPVFGALNKLEKIIYQNGGPYILGKSLTELDIRAYATIVRFDPVYVQHFKCNLGTIRHNYPVINNWLKNLYWNVKGFKETTDFKHIKENVGFTIKLPVGVFWITNFSEPMQYTKSHYEINPKHMTPMGPYPHIEEGVKANVASLKPGEISHPAVLEYEATL